MALRVTEYTDKSYAIFGETAPWAENIKQLGGKFNSKLREGPGWIFSKSQISEESLNDFVAAANGGTVQPAAANPNRRTKATPLAPMTTGPAMSPQDAIARLRAAPKPVTAKPSTPTVLNFPNVFVAADGLQYQVLVQTVPLPEVGQSLTLSLTEGQLGYSVVTVNAEGNTIHIRPVAEGESESLSEAVIVNGAWKVNGMVAPHILTFSPLQ